MRREVSVRINDQDLAVKLLSNPQKNKSLQFIWMVHSDNSKTVWMLVDGATER